MAERQSGGITALRGSTVEELRQELQFILQHLANQVDQLQGNRGTPTIRADVDFTGKRLTNLGAPKSANDAVPANLALTRPTATQPYDAGGTTIINVQGGATTSDAVNVSQLREALAASDLSAETFVVVSLSGKLSQERQLAIEASVLSLLDNGAGATIVLGVATNGISDAKLRDSAAVSVIGRSANSSGDPADIAAAANGHVLRRAANVVGFGQVDLTDGTNAVTGALAIGNGGTGQTTATAAFNALDPLTTKGDHLAHDGTNSVRVAVGSNGQLLVADSAASPGVAWKGTPQSYALTNGTTDRALDCDSTTIDEVADCLATLIADLKTFGILS